MASNGHHTGTNGHQGHPADMWVFPKGEEVSADLVRKTLGLPKGIGLGLLLSGVLLGLGGIGFVVRAVDNGFDDHAPWGYYMAIFSFVFMLTSAAPLAAIAFRLTKNHWRRPISRIAELFAVAGVLNILMFIPLMLVMPPMVDPASLPGEPALRKTIWLEVPIGAPLWWDMLGVAVLAVLGIFILWLSAMPDMAEARLSSTGLRRKVYGWLAGHWYGAKWQWTIQKAGLAVLGAFYFMFLVFVGFLVSSDYGLSLVPGWKDSIFPPFYTLTSFQAALGAILVVAFIARRWGGYREYIGVAQFWAPSKVLLGLTLLWVYHLFAFGITYWYGRLPVEQDILKYLMFESYGGLFAANLFLSFVAPFLILIWNPVRKSDWGPTLAGVSALAGAICFNLRIFVGSFNAGDIYSGALKTVPPPVYPDLWDVLIFLGGVGGLAFIYLAATRLFPLVSIWETKEGTLYQKRQTFVRGEYLVLAKPE